MANIKMTPIDFDILDITIDPKFEGALPEMSQEDAEQLEENILAEEEIRDAFIIWPDPETGHYLLVDGHHRLSVMKDHPEIDFPYTVREADFTDKWEAIAWILANCIGHRNLNDIQHKRIIAKYSEAIKMTHGGDRRSDDFSSDQSGHLKSSPKTRKQTAEKFGVGEGTVERAIGLDKAINEGEKESPGFAKQVESGDITAPQSMISNITKVPEEHRKEYIDSLTGIKKDNTAQENKENKQKAQDIYTRYTKEAIDSAMGQLDSFSEDPFSRCGTDEPKYEVPEAAKIRSADDPKPEDTLDVLCMSIRSAIKQLDGALDLYIKNFKDILKKGGDLTPVEEALDEGNDVLDKYRKIIIDYESEGE